MTEHNPRQLRRVNVTAFKEAIASASDAELEEQQRDDQARYEREYHLFLDAYRKEKCYLCGNSFKTLSKERPCVHWLLRRGRFKKKDLPRLFGTFGFTQFAAFTRWVANQERPFGNINDLEIGRDSRKLFQFTVCWKNIKWAFDCSKNDYLGHTGKHTDFPHFHLQMRIDNQPFIDFGDFHIPFTEEDLFRIDLTLGAPDVVNASYGEAGMGMQFTAEIDPEVLIEESQLAESDELATHRMLTVIKAEDGRLDGNALLEIFRESERTGELVANLARKKLGDSHSVKTIISPAESVPEIAKRSERNRR